MMNLFINIAIFIILRGKSLEGCLDRLWVAASGGKVYRLEDRLAGNSHGIINYIEVVVGDPDAVVGTRTMD